MKGIAAVFTELDAATVVEGRLLAGWVKVRWSPRIGQVVKLGST
jgi:hypothetical protein